MTMSHSSTSLERDFRFEQRITAVQDVGSENT